MLSRFSLMVQAAVLDCQFFDLLPPFNDGGIAPEVGNLSKPVSWIKAWGFDYKTFLTWVKPRIGLGSYGHRPKLLP
jgi:hypothetical protein